MDQATVAGNGEKGNVSPDLLRALNAGLQALPTAFRAHQKTLATFASALLAAPHLHGAVKLEAALLYSLCPRLTGKPQMTVFTSVSCEVVTWCILVRSACSRC